MKTTDRPFAALLVVLTAGICLGVTPAVAQEHPEHPSSDAELTKDSLGDAIEMLVASMEELQGGYFCVFDDANNTPLALTLDKVHRERLASLGDGVYFACADFKAVNGGTYDLDIFMTQESGGMFNGFMPTRVTVHKQDGEARYTWYEESGAWKMKHSPAGSE